MGCIKRIWKFFITILTLVLFVQCVAVNGAVAQDLKVEQVTAKMPEIKAYITGTGAAELDPGQIEAYRGEEALKIKEVKRFGDTGEGIRYYLLLDISGSMTPEEFQAFKDASLVFARQLQEKDEISVLTFGDTVEVLWNKKEGLETLNERLLGLTNDNMNTQLYEALSQTGDLCMQQTDMGRKAAIILSDGVDDMKGMATKNEAEKKLKEAGIPVYGIAIGEDNQEGVDRFGELARGSGGELYIAQTENVEEQLLRLKDKLGNTGVLYMEAENNLVSKEVERLQIEFKELNLKKEVEAGFYQWTPDATIPEITGVKQIGKNQIEITFSEPVSHLNELSNFELVDEEGKEIVPQGAASEADRTVKLTFEENFQEGNYTLECNNITDISMEKNPLKENTAELSLTGEREAELMNFLKAWGWLGVLIGLLLLVLIICIVYRKIKKNKGILVVDEKLTLASQVEDHVRQRINVEEKEGMHLFIFISSGRSEQIELERDIFDSIIVGRSEMCELCVEDNRMSKQHFVIEYEEKNIFITDLESTNGTMVNGIRIKKRQKLTSNDVVTAGNTDFRIGWEALR